MNKIINWIYDDPCFEKNEDYYEEIPTCQICKQEVEQADHDFCNNCILEHQNTQTNE